jgi:asparagine synthase (glutamine-hydrolysing)
MYRDMMQADCLSKSDVIDRVTALCLGGYLRNQLLRDIDAMSMSHSLEVRVPFVDPIVVDLALSLPPDIKIGEIDSRIRPANATYREMGVKRVLVDIVRPYLPRDIDTQPKRGFNLPMDAWLRGPMQDILIDTLSTDTLRRQGIFDPRTVVEIRDSFLDAEQHWTRPWLLLLTTLWIDRYTRDRIPISLPTL